LTLRASTEDAERGRKGDAVILQVRVCGALPDMRAKVVGIRGSLLPISGFLILERLQTAQIVVESNMIF
jgi:hypothetical protein